jgi:AraC family transcriptional regulator of adaptative response / DNA-3-methyladenine glycosylase II
VSATLDPRACHRALSARDARFDGVFFVGVSTTGVYCRPVCPARTPRADRCAYFEHAAEAERAGFRACFRCRPELAPGHAPVDARPRIVRAAVDAIARGALAKGGVEPLARRLGVSSRHLRRSIETELGVTPIELETTRRLGVAKQLLTDTALPLAQVAFGAGFGSVRRFNDAFASRFGRPPSAMRRATDRRAIAGPDLHLRLDHRGPLDWDALLAFVAPRAIPGVERVEDGQFVRAIALDGEVGWMRVAPRRDRDALELSLSASLAKHASRLSRAVRDLFDLDARPDRVGAALSGDRMLAKLVTARPGLRVPGALEPFEVAVRSVLAQQVSVAAATTLVGRVAARFGRPIDTGVPGLDRAFPDAATLADATPSQIAAIGLPGSRARALSALARAVALGTIDLAGLTPPRDVVAALVELPGIGPFTAEVIAMRALRDADAFPAGDLVLARRLGKRALERAEAWRPYRAYAAMYLWTDEGAKKR